MRGLWLFRRPGFLADADVPALRVTGSLASGLTIVGLAAEAALAAVFARRLSFGIPPGVTAQLKVSGGVAPCWGSACGALNRIPVAVEISFAASIATLPLAAFGRSIDLLKPLLAPDPTRGPVRRQLDGNAAATCFCCGRPLEQTGRHSRFILAAGPLAVTPAWAALIAAQPDFRPAWGIAPADASA